MEQNLTTRIIADIERWLTDGNRVWLCTILRTWGSSPRPAGSLLAVNDQGHWSGSVSGGCIEQRLLEEARTRQQSDPDAAPHLIDYGISDEDQAQFRLPCGGNLQLLVEPLLPGRDLPHIATIHGQLLQRQPATRRVVIASGERSLLDHTIPGGITEEGGVLIHSLGPGCRMLLIGAGEVARYVARMALAADFMVTLCEPREAFLEGWDEPGVEVRRELPDDLIAAEFQDRYCAILALGHDPRIDDMGLLAAMDSQAFYIGAMGSQRTHAQRKNRLYELGIPAHWMGTIHAPIGFDIGSKTPAEIAIATMAQVVAERHRRLQRNSRL